MRSFLLTDQRLDALQLTQVPSPRPKDGEVLVRLHATSLNHLDLLVARDGYGNTSHPLIPGTDGAGEIAALGAGVSGWSVGERVIPALMIDWPDGPYTETSSARARGVNLPGSLADYTTVPAHALVRTPGHLSDVQASTLPIAATTAWRAMSRGQVGPSSTVLLLGTGGVSVFALQLAKALGARVIVTSSSDEKLQQAQALGADEIINYRTTPAWDAEVLALTAGRGADLVLEAVGKATFARSINACAVSGVIFVIGFMGGTHAEVPMLPIIAKALTIAGNSTGSTADLADVTQFMAAHGIEPVIDRVFPFEQAPAAYRYLADAGHFGKVVIDPQ